MPDTIDYTDYDVFALLALVYQGIEGAKKEFEKRLTHVELIGDYKLLIFKTTE